MGNNSSSRASSSATAAGNSKSVASSRRASAARGLDKFTQPTGLYPSCPWELKAARRLVLEKKIAPRFPGRESKESCFTQECPICFMFYPGNLNVSACCKKPICSECYLQIKPPKKVISCPFCNREAFGIKYSAPAVIELSSIYLEPNQTELQASDLPAHAHTPESAHYASVEDRHKLRDDLRSQLNISVGPITTPAPVSSVAVQDALMYASPADASHLEELMILEAIRRSMYDLTLPKNDESAASGDGVATGASGGGGRGARAEAAMSEDGDYSDGEPMTPSQIELLSRRRFSSSARQSTNPFDDNFDARSSSSSAGASEQLSAHSRSNRTDDWNPFQSE